MRTNTRLAILKRAERYLQSTGYASFSFRRIAEDLGIRSASVHYHFASKEDLGVELLRSYRERFAKWQESRKANETPKAALRQWFDYWSGMCEDGEICPGGAFATEWRRLPTKVREEVKDLQNLQLEWLRDTLARGRASGEFAKFGKVEDQAVAILASLQGAVQIARVRKDVGVINAVLAQIHATVFA